MKVEVTYTEEWTRKQTVEVDEAEVREWLGVGADHTITADEVERFFEATDWSRVNDPGVPEWVLVDPTSNPGDRDSDQFYGTDLDGVRLLTDERPSARRVMEADGV